jgi:hypothetical protein
MSRNSTLLKGNFKKNPLCGKKLVHIIVIIFTKKVYLNSFQI